MLLVKGKESLVLEGKTRSKMVMQAISRTGRGVVLGLGLLALVSQWGINGKAESGVFTSVLPSGWYEQTQAGLVHQIAENFDIASTFFDVAVDANSIRVIIAPHAGYGYSGIAAASVYRLLFSGLKSASRIKSCKNTHIKRVIVLAPSHHVAFKGLAVPDFAIYRTVLGDIPVDQLAIDALKCTQKASGATPIFKVVEGVYAQEHSLEVQLPFLQTTVADFKLVPLIVGDLPGEMVNEVATVMRSIIDSTTLLVISSDFVHQGPNYGYQPFIRNVLDQVRQFDSQVVRAVVEGSLKKFTDVLEKTGATVCGREPLRIFLALRESGAFGMLESRFACYYTSLQREKTHRGKAQRFNIEVLMGDCSDAEAQNSVSYVGMLFTTQRRAMLPLIDRLTAYEKRALLKLARETIKNEFAGKGTKRADDLLLPIASEGLLMSAGAFVTLTKAGNLRGCIGRITTDDPLYLTVQKMSHEAAFSDSRFSPVSADELPNLVIDISVLEKPVNVSGWKDITIGKHGIILKEGRATAVFLPQVAIEQGWNLETTLQHLSIKAGLDRDAWKTATFQVFEGCEFKE